MPATWWSVLIEFAAPDGADLLDSGDERLDLFADAVDEHDGAVGGGGSDYSVRLSVQADDAAIAALHGRDLAWKAARRADLPEWPFVRLEAIAQGRLASELGRVKPPKLVGAAEVTKVLGVSRQRLAELRSEKDDFPRPIAELAAGPVWLEPAVRSWIAGWERRPGRPRRTGGLARPSAHVPERIEKLEPVSPARSLAASGQRNVYRSAKTGRFVGKAAAKQSRNSPASQSRGKATKRK